MTSVANNSSRSFSLLSHETLLAALLLVQIIFWFGIPVEQADETHLWQGTRTIKPRLDIVPEVPTEHAVKALSLGDEQFYFRLLAFSIQNAGDTYGRVTPLKDYDYAQLYRWWSLLDILDARSNYIPTLVSYYFGASQEPKRDVPYVVKYLEEHADRDPAHKWWWYGQAVTAANFKLKDKEVALRIAKKLHAVPPEVKMPAWARQMAAFIYENMGEHEQAFIIIQDLKKNLKDLPPQELNFMQYYVKERLAALDEATKSNFDASIEAEKKRRAAEEAESDKTEKAVTAPQEE